MKLNEYYVCDADGNIVEKVKAKTLFNMFQSDGTSKWTLMYVDGDRINRAEKDGEMFCHPHCWVDPALDFTDKVREGCEKEFDFFLQRGYHMTRKDA